MDLLHEREMVEKAAGSELNIQDYKRALEQIISLAQAQKFALACQKIDELLDQGVVSTELLVHRGRFIQLFNEEDINRHPNLTLETVLEDLETARDLAPEAIDPLLELGYFKYAVQDDSASALNTFIQAETLAKSYLKDSLVGQVKCYQDLRLFNKAQEKLC